MNPQDFSISEQDLLTTPRTPMIRSLIHAIISIALALISLCTGQQQEFGFLNIVNMVPKNPPCEIQFDGKDLMPGGLKAINSTGWFIVPQGTYRMTLKIEGFERAKGTITVAPHTSTLCVVFLQQIGHPKDQDGKPIPPKIRIKRLASPPPSQGRHLRIVSLCPEEEAFQLGGKPMTLKPLEETTIDQWSGAPWNVVHQTKKIGQCLGADEKCHYTLLLGSNHRRSMAALLVRSEAQEVPPWMKEKKP